ncbi:LysR family transcriptional regulator [Streptomyces aureoverticillatus]|nr:LysR family transcriptional regulator [Streptomyces aureoverticillatus]
MVVPYGEGVGATHGDEAEAVGRTGGGGAPGARGGAGVAGTGTGTDLDLAQARAFVLAADLLHFGRAAARLGITQQALSKRVARLEVALGARLFERTGRGVDLTDEGRRFLEPARRALAAGRAAVAAVRPGRRGLRVDAWGHLYGPMRTLATVIEVAPHLGLEPGAGRDLPSVARALRRGEAEAGFGRVPPGLLPADLSAHLVRVEPVDVLLGAAHPLAGAPALRPADLRDSVLRYPGEPARLDFLTRFADHFGIANRVGGPNLGLDPFLTRLRADPTHFSLFPADAPLPDVPGLRSIPLHEPTPLYAWSLVHLNVPPKATPDAAPRLAELLRTCATVAAGHRWLEHDPAQDWLPD